MAAGGGVCNCAYTDLCHRRIHYPAAASPYRILRITLRSFLFPWFTPAHHHLQLSRIIYQNIIYTEFGLPNSSFSLLRRYMRVWIFFILFYLFFLASEDLGSDSAFCLDWAESDALKPFQTCFFFPPSFFKAAVDSSFFLSPLHFVWSLAAGHFPWRISSRLWVLNSSDVVSCDAWHLHAFR